MKKTGRILFILFFMLFIFSPQAHAYSIRHHFINIGKNLCKFTLAPLNGLFIKGPQNIKEAYRYEVYGSDDPAKNGLLRKKIFALWRAPGEEAKGLIDGVVESVIAGAECLKNFLSIFFSD